MIRFAELFDDGRWIGDGGRDYLAYGALTLKYCLLAILDKLVAVEHPIASLLR